MLTIGGIVAFVNYKRYSCQRYSEKRENSYGRVVFCGFLADVAQESSSAALRSLDRQPVHRAILVRAPPRSTRPILDVPHKRNEPLALERQLELRDYRALKSR